MNSKELERAIYQEWSDMHHNASIDWPDLQNEYESELFWACLSEDVKFWCDDLSEHINDKFGKGVLINLLIGKYHRPREKVRILI